MSALDRNSGTPTPAISIPRYLGVGIIGAVVVIGVIYGWCWAFPYRWCPPCWSFSSATIVLEDAHVSAWMAIENRWIGTPNDPIGTLDVCPTSNDPAEVFGACWANYEDPDDYRDGVLFQLGPVMISGSPEYHFKEVEVQHSVGSTTFVLGPPSGSQVQFDWLDVNTVGTPCPIDALHAYSLFQNKVVKTACDEPIHACEKECSDASGMPKSKYCLRNRDLHVGLRPDGLLTYWAGPKHYDVEARTSTHKHVKYDFELRQRVSVDYWLGGCFKYRLSGVERITVKYQEPESQHNRFHDPPMNGRPLQQP